MKRLILGSQSPRRRELVQFLGLPVQTMAADADEESVSMEDPKVNVLQTAVLKKEVLLPLLPPETEPNQTLLLTADTTVAFEGSMLNKPASEAEAEMMLRALRGRQHAVHTGFHLLDLGSGQIFEDVDTGIVTMRHYSDAEIDAYIATGDPMDKAGAYAIQHPTFKPVERLEGCYLNVMGLPVCRLLTLFAQQGWLTEVDTTAVRAAHKGYPCSEFDQFIVNLG